MLALKCKTEYSAIQQQDAQILSTNKNTRSFYKCDNKKLERKQKITLRYKQKIMKIFSVIRNVLIHLENFLNQFLQTMIVNHPKCLNLTLILNYMILH